MLVGREGRRAYYSARSPLDCFNSEALEEIRTLEIEIPSLKKISKNGECEL